MHRSAIFGICAVSIASFLSGCVIVIGNEDDFDDGYHASWDVDVDDDRVASDNYPDSGTLLGDVRARFNEDDELRAEPLLIAAKDGVVTLSGDVSDARTLDRAVELASTTPGVDSVVLKVVVAVNQGAGG